MTWVKVAVPWTSGAVPTAAPSTRNLTLPVCRPAPGATGATVAVTVVGCTPSWVVVAARATLSARGVLREPVYVVASAGTNIAATWCAPGVSVAPLLSVSVALAAEWSAATATGVPTSLPSTLNWTVPAGVPEVVPTVAIAVTGCP